MKHLPSSFYEVTTSSPVTAFIRDMPQLCVYRCILWLGCIFFVCALQANKVKLQYSVIPAPPENEVENLPPIIFLHGLTDTRKTWMRVAPEIGKNTGRKIYAYDARNHGESDWSDQFDEEILASDLEQLMEDQNVSRAVIVGHSLGGKTAMIFAVNKPEKVEKLIVEDMATKIFSLEGSIYGKRLMGIIKESLAEVPPEADESTARASVINFIEALLPESLSGPPDTNFLMQWLPIKKTNEGYVWQANIDLFEKIMYAGEKWEKGVSGVFGGDVLFLYGSESPFATKSDKSIEVHFPNVTRVELDEGYHWLHYQFPEKFVREVSKFINK